MIETGVEYIRDQMRTLPDITFRRMFGGYGIYSGGKFFGILYRDRLYFKTDPDSRAAYVVLGMEPFRPSAKQTLTSYYELPPDILDDAEELVTWARRSIIAASHVPPRKTARRTTQTGKTRRRSTK